MDLRNIFLTIAHLFTATSTREPGSISESTVIPEGFKIAEVPWTRPAPMRYHERTSIYSLDDLHEYAPDGARFYVSDKTITAVWDVDLWRHDQVELPLKLSKAWLDWTNNTISGDPRTLLLWLMRHREQLVDKIILSDLRSLKIGTSGKLELEVDDDGTIRSQVIDKKTTKSTPLVQQVLVRVAPWVGIDVFIDLEFLVQIDAEGTPKISLPLITDADEALRLGLVQIRDRLVESGRKAYLGTYGRNAS